MSRISHVVTPVRPCVNLLFESGKIVDHMVRSYKIARASGLGIGLQYPELSPRETTTYGFKVYGFKTLNSNAETLSPKPQAPRSPEGPKNPKP